MANTSKKIPIKEKSHMVNTKWLNNVVRSIGGSTVKVIKETAPTLSDITISTGRMSSDILRSMRGGKVGMDNIGRQISNNKYVRFANKSLKNALEDLKTGNLNNESRMEAALFGDDSSDSGFTFGDEDIDGEGSVNINVDGGSGDIGAGFMSLSQQMNLNSETIVKAAEATMNAQIASTSASIFQSQKLGQEIISRLDNINGGVQALVQYNNQTMTKFVEASLGYYERMGSTLAPLETPGGQSKTNASDIFSSNGTFNTSAYKNYLKESIKKTADKSGLGMVNALLDDTTLDMIAANPLGAGLDIAVKAVIPKMITTTLGEMESQFNNLTASFLHNIADWADTSDSSTGGKLKKLIGEIAGIKTKRERFDTKASVVKNGPIPYDSDTKTAITQVITKELSEQTAYLKVISENIGSGGKRRRGGSSKVPQFSYYNYAKGEYQTKDEISSGIVNDLKDTVLAEMNNSKFGETLRNGLLSKQGSMDSKTYKDMESIMNKFMVLAMKDGKAVNFRDKSATSNYTKIKSQFGNSEAEQVFFKYLEDLELTDPAAANNLSVAILRAVEANNNKIQEMMADPSRYNMHFTQFKGDDNNDQVFDKILELLGDQDAFKGAKATAVTQTRNTYSGNTRAEMLANMSNSFMGRANAMAKNIIHGDATGAGKEFGKMIGDQVAILGDVFSDKFLLPMKRSIFGVKDDNGIRSDGIFADALNGISDMTKHIKNSITGKSYKLSDGTTIAENEDSFFSSFKNMGKSMKNYVFGSKAKYDENGNLLTEGTQGLLQKMGDTIKQGFSGWNQALFGPELADGENLTPEEYEKRMKENKQEFFNKVQKALPKGVAGAAAGLGFGTLSGGILGNLVGGPIGGAVLGSALGFASNSKSFNKWLFGETDENGNEIAQGIISQKTQKFFKDNKHLLAGTSLAGMAVGTVSGAGLLGNLVGGPICGAVLGLGAGILSKSQMFHDFLYGNGENGREGIVTMLKKSFGRYNWGKDAETASGGKLLGMSAIGAGAGAITGSMLASSGVLGIALGPAGPIGGALLGLSLSMFAQKDNFKTWLFGKKDKDGNKVKEGVLGQAKNSIMANAINPLITDIKSIGRGFRRFFKYSILGNIQYAFQPLADAMADIGHSFKESVGGLFKKGGELFKANIVTPIFNLATYPIRKTASVLADFTNGVMSRVAEKLTDGIASITRGVIKGGGKLISGMIKGIGNVGGGLLDKARGFVGLPKKDKSAKHVSRFGKIRSKLSDVAKNGFKDWNQADLESAQQKISEAEERGDKDPYESLTKKERNALFKYSRYNERVADNEATKVDKKHDDLAKDIAKYTNNQFGQDTVAGREAMLFELKRNPIKNAAKIKKYEEMFKSFDARDQKEIDEKKRKEAEEKKKEAEAKKKDEEAAKLAQYQADSVQTIEQILCDMYGYETSGKQRKRIERKIKKHEKKINKEAKKRGINLDEADESIIRSLVDGTIDDEHADGTNSADAGLALVGENGPELVTMKGGEQVIPTGKVASYLKHRKEALQDKARHLKDRAARVDALNKIKERGVTAAELLQSKKDAMDQEWKGQVLDLLKKGTSATVEQARSWMDTFDIKKGVIGLLLLKFGPQIFKMLANLDWDAIMATISNVGTSILSGINYALGMMGWTEKEQARTDGNTAGEQIAAEVDRGFSITNKDGNWDHESGSRLKAMIAAPAGFVKKIGTSVIKHKSIKQATAEAAEKYGKNIFSKTVGKVKGTGRAYKQIASETISSAKAIGSGVKNVASKVASGASKFADDVATSGLMKTVVDGIKTFFKSIKDKIVKAGYKIAGKSIDDVAETALKVVAKNADDVLVKAAPAVGVKAGLTATGVGVLVNVAVVGLSAINGISGAARLFQIDESAVDGKMTFISTIIGGFSGTMVGSIVDAVNEVVASVTGTSLITALAVAVYNLISGQEDEEALKAAQEKFKTEYTDYQSNEIEKQYKNMKAAGLIGEDVSQDAFIAGVKDGTYSASYDSFLDYNDSQHKTWAGKAGDTIVSAASAVKRNTWDKVFGSKKVSYTDEKTGQRYVKNNKGSFDVYDKDGNLMKNADGSTVTVNEDNISKLGFTKEEKREGSIFSKENIGNTLKDTGKQMLTNAFFGPAGMAFNTIDKLTDGTEFGDKFDASVAAIKNGAKDLADSAIDKAKGALDEVKAKFGFGGSTKTGAGVNPVAVIAGVKGAKMALGAAKAFMNTTTKKVTIYRDIINPSCYFKFDESAKVWNYYNATDSMVQSKSGLTQEEMDELINTNLVTEDVFEENATIKDRINAAVSSTKEELSKLADSGKNALDKFKSMFTGGGSGVGKVFDAFFGDDSSTKVTGGGSGRGRRGLRGGRGNVPYFSQEDPTWGSMAYGNDGATMADTGCGPTAMSMIATHFGGMGTSPVDMANLAQATGDRDATGTNFNFIDKASAIYGIDSTKQYMPSSNYIASNLAAGNPMILSGASGKGSVPYTPAGHYVVATGIDSNGNISVNDPRGRQYSGKYNLNDVTNSTSAAWAFGGRGPQRVGGNRADEYEARDARLLASASRKASSSHSSSVVTEEAGVTAADVIAAAKNEVGYLEKASNNNLNDKTANPSTSEANSNYTKYNTVVGSIKQPWCAAFVCWCVNAAAGGDKELVKKILCGNMSASCQGLLNNLRGANRTSKTPEPGDFIFFKYKTTRHNNETSHIGIVVTSDGTNVYTIEGNTSGGINVGLAAHDGGSVAEKTHKLNADYILGYGHPMYANTSANLYDNSLASTFSGSTGAMSSSASVSGGGISSIFDTIASVLGDLANKAWGVSSSATTSPSGGSTSAGFYTGDTNSSGLIATSGSKIEGTENGQKIWNYFKKKGMPPQGIAALMGNLHAESGLQTNNMENGYEGKLGMNDKSYTEGVTKGTYGNFVNDAVGYGLAQWTYHTRKKALLDMARRSNLPIDDIGLQLDYLNSELGSSYKSVSKALYGATDINSASNVVLHDFENPKHQGPNVEMERANRGHQMFNLYGGGSGRGRRGGRGASVRRTRPNYGTNFSATNAKNFVSSIGGGYGSGNNDQVNAQFMALVVSALTEIAKNTGTTSENIKSLQASNNALINSSSNTTNTIVTANGKTASTKSSSSITSNKSGKNAELAAKIAKG